MKPREIVLNAGGGFPVTTNTFELWSLVFISPSSCRDFYPICTDTSPWRLGQYRLGAPEDTDTCHLAPRGDGVAAVVPGSWSDWTGNRKLTPNLHSERRKRSKRFKGAGGRGNLSPVHPAQSLSASCLWCSKNWRRSWEEIGVQNWSWWQTPAVLYAAVSRPHSIFRNWLLCNMT